MATTLRHRTGGTAPLVAAAPRCTVAVAGRSGSDHGMVHCDDRRTSVAFAGRLGAGATIDDLAERVATDGPAALARTGGDWIVAIATPERLVVGRDAAVVRTV